MLRNFALPITCLALAMPVTGSDANARARIIAVANDLDTATAGLAHLALNNAFLASAPNDTLLLVNASTRQRTEKVVFSGSGIANPAVKRTKFGAAINRGHDFIDDRTKAVPASPVRSNLMIPQLMAEIGDTVASAVRDEPIDLVLIGSARSYDSREPSFGFLEGRFPSDGHIDAAHDQSPWSTRGRENALRGVNVHLCYVEPDEDFVNSYQRKMIGRFYWMWLAAQGGNLATFTADMRSCLDRFAGGETDVAETFTRNPAWAGVFMIRVLREHDAAALPPRTVPNTAGQLFAAPVCSVAPVSTRAALRIGIRWHCPLCDLDLWSRAASSNPFISFQNKQTGEGWLNQDFLVSPGDNAYEIITYNAPVELRNVEAFVNFYAGQDPNGPDFDVRVWLNDCAFESHFHLPATKGNGAAGRFSGPAWVRLDLKEIAGLRPSAAK
jgi:hypothetical protein